MHRVGGLVEFVGQRRCDGVSRFEERTADPVRVADDKGYGHRLAESASEPEHDAPDHAYLGVWKHDVPNYFPSGATDAVGRFFKHRRDDFEYVAHHRADERDHHHRQDDTGRKYADAVWRALEQWSD